MAIASPLSAAKKQPADEKGSALIVATRPPLPVKDGADLRVLQLIEQLTAKYNVHLITAIPADLGECIHSAKIASLTVIPESAHQNYLTQLGRRLYRKILRPKFDSAFYLPPSLHKIVAMLQQKHRFSLAIASTPKYAPLVNAMPSTTLRITDAVDLWYERYQEFNSLGCGQLLDHFRDPERELANYQASDKVLAISSHDYSELRRQNLEEHKLCHVPMGFELKPIKPASSGTMTILFAGASGLTNEEAVRWFVDHVLAKVRASIPSANLLLTRVPEHLRQQFAERKDITCLPFLKSIDEAYRLARVVVVPIQRGSGIKIKVLEAFSRGAATIVTPAAIQGIQLAGPPFQTTSDPTEFAEQVIAALSQDSIHQQLRHHGEQVISKYYLPKIAYKPLQEAIQPQYSQP